MLRLLGLNQISWVSLAAVGAFLIALQGCQKKGASTTDQAVAPAAVAPAGPSAPALAPQKSQAPQAQAPAPVLAPAAVPAAPAAPQAPAPTCFNQTFTHKELASHSDGEACSQHRNRIAIRHAGVNPSALCVRVDGTPFKFKAVKDKKNKDGLTIVFGPVAGPQSRIVASYCVGKEPVSYTHLTLPTNREV